MAKKDILRKTNRQTEENSANNTKSTDLTQKCGKKTKHQAERKSNF